MSAAMPTWTAPGGLRLHFRDVGSRLPVVLLHAFPLLGEMFEPQWSALASRARFIVPDLRGFGGSSAGDGPSEMGAMADDVLALLDHLGIDAAVVGGVSMGGYVSLALLRNDPSRVRALVLADTQTSADDAPARERRETTAQELLSTGPTALLPTVDKLLGPAASPELRARVSAWITGGSAEGLAAAQRGMALRPDARDILARFGGPVLVVVGSEDVLTPPAKARAMVDLVPGAALVEIPDAGHLASLEKPAHFNAALARFLDRVSPPADG
jgi:pimeloyl-ACP methyl ester carboxylesterase